jgi:CBS domain-containing protein
MFSTPAREYMSRSLISVRPDQPLDELARILEERDISCVAVTDDQGHPIGIVSTTDLLREALLPVAPSEGPPSRPRVARDVMSTTLIGVDEMQTVREAAQAMVTHLIHRVLVYRADRAVAVLSTRDVMRAVMFHHVELPLAAVMTAPVETVEVGERIDAAIARLGQKNVRGLVVVDGDFPVGLFTEHEALKARLLPHEVLMHPVEQVMSYQMLALDAQTPLYRVAGHAIATRARRVVAIEGRVLKGIATGFDIARVATMDVD